MAVLAELFRKIDKTYKQTNSTLCSSKEAFLKNNVLKKNILGVTFLHKYVEVHTSASENVTAVCFVFKMCRFETE